MPGQGDVGAVDVGGGVDDGVQRDDVAEAVLGLFGQADRAVRRRDPHADAVAVERRQRVLQPDAELADNHVAGPLLVRLVLRQVLVSQPAAAVADVPHAAVVLDDLRPVDASEEGVLVEGVGDDLTQRMGRGPVLQHLLDVEIERLHHHRLLPTEATERQSPRPGPADEIRDGPRPVGVDEAPVRGNDDRY